MPPAVSRRVTFRDKNLDLSQATLQRLGEQYVDGRLTLEGFGDGVRKELRSASAAAYRFAVGRQLTSVEAKELSKILAAQDQFLLGFIRDIVGAGEETGFVPARAALYVSGVLQADSAGALAKAGKNAVVTWVGPDGGSSCEDCAPLIGKSWPRAEFKAMGVVPGTTACKGHCRCSLRVTVGSTGEKYNAYHDRLGRFSSGNAATFVSFRPGTTSGPRQVVSSSAPLEELTTVVPPAGTSAPKAVVDRASQKIMDELSSLDRPVEVGRKQLDDAAKLIAETTNVRIQLPATVLDDVLSGGVKNQHETGTTGGKLAKNQRTAAESNMFGIGKKAAPGDHPVYGFLQERDDHDVPSLVSQYGGVRLTLKDHVASRTTFTVGDSFGPGKDGTVAPPLLSAPSAHAFGSVNVGRAIPEMDAARISHGTNKVGAPYGVREVQRASRSYIEAQVHGGVKPSDIAHVTFTRDGAPTETQRARMAELGITWSTGAKVYINAMEGKRYIDY